MPRPRSGSLIKRKDGFYSAKVTASDGSRLEYGILPAGTQKSYRSDKTLDVRIGAAKSNSKVSAWRGPAPAMGAAAPKPWESRVGATAKPDRADQSLVCRLRVIRPPFNVKCQVLW